MFIHVLITLGLCLISYGLTYGILLDAWEKRDTTNFILFIVLCVLATLVWQYVWDSTTKLVS